MLMLRCATLFGPGLPALVFEFEGGVFGETNGAENDRSFGGCENEIGDCTEGALTWSSPDSSARTGGDCSTLVEACCCAAMRLTACEAEIGFGARVVYTIAQNKCLPYDPMP